MECKFIVGISKHFLVGLDVPFTETSNSDFGYYILTIRSDILFCELTVKAISINKLLTKWKVLIFYQGFSFTELSFL